jgi:hypothetical protein
VLSTLSCLSASADPLNFITSAHELTLVDIYLLQSYSYYSLTLLCLFAPLSFMVYAVVIGPCSLLVLHVLLFRATGDAQAMCSATVLYVTPNPPFIMRLQLCGNHSHSVVFNNLSGSTGYLDKCKCRNVLTQLSGRIIWDFGPPGTWQRAPNVLGDCQGTWCSRSRTDRRQLKGTQRCLRRDPPRHLRSGEGLEPGGQARAEDRRTKLKRA